MRLMALVAFLALTACGVDGPPVSPAGPEPGVHIGGEARIGVVSTL